jgi:biopolymer transport protein TolR
MAMNLGGGGGVKSDINVTPLVDVMLVLLIIMMIVAPLLQQGVPVKLPLATNSNPKPESQEQTVVAITADKRFFRRVEELLETKKEKLIIIKADEDVEYSAVMDAMDELRAGGIEDMGLITETRKVQGGE